MKKRMSKNQKLVILFLSVIIIVELILLSEFTGFAISQLNKKTIVLEEEKILPVQSTCTDTDKGINIYIEGTTCDGGAGGGLPCYRDECNGDYILEYYCEDGITKGDWFECSSGMCSNGACFIDPDRAYYISLVVAEQDGGATIRVDDSTKEISLGGTKTIDYLPITLTRAKEYIDHYEATINVNLVFSQDKNYIQLHSSFPRKWYEFNLLDVSEENQSATFRIKTYDGEDVIKEISFGSENLGNLSLILKNPVYKNDSQMIADILVENLELISYANCFDTDGLNYTNKGNIYGNYTDGSPFSLFDYCDGDLLVEQTCELGQPYFRGLNCANYGSSCVNGACLPFNGTCIESDSGIDYFNYGNNYGYYSNLSFYDLNDYCLNNNTINEFYCPSNFSEVKNVLFNCSDINATCDGGYKRCILNLKSCTDSDGYDPIVFGYIYGIRSNSSSFQYNDTCVDNSSVIEYWCSSKDSYPISSERSCKLYLGNSNASCINGACVPSCRAASDLSGEQYVYGSYSNGTSFKIYDECIDNETLRRVKCDANGYYGEPFFEEYNCLANEFDGCVSNKCINICYKDKDCSPLEGYYCSGNKVFANTSRRCVNPGTINSYCEDVIGTTLVNDCGTNSQCVDGIKCCQKEPEKFFPIGLWMFNKTNFSVALDLNVNTILPIKYNIESNILFNKLLDDANKKSIKVFGNSPWYGWFIDDVIRKVKVNSVCGYNSFSRYIVMDEPYPEELDGLKRAYERIKFYDKQHPAYTTVHLPWIFEDFVETVQPNELDIHNFPIQPETPYPDEDSYEYDKAINEYGIVLSQARDITLRHNIPLWATTQSFVYQNEDNTQRDMLLSEARLLNYMPLAYGSKGISHFIDYSYPESGRVVSALIDINGQKTQRYYEIKEFNRKLKKIAPILLELNSTGACNSRFINYFPNQANIIINPSFETTTPTSIDGWNGDPNLVIANGATIGGCNSGSKCSKAIRANWGFHQIISGMQPDTYYELSYSLKEGPIETIPRVHIYSSTGESIIGCSSNPEDSWKRVSCVFRTPFTLTGNPVMYVISGTDPFDSNEFNYVDDIDLRKINPFGGGCNISSITEVSGNLEIGTFIDVNNDNYIMVVNRDTLNPITTDLTLSVDLSKYNNPYLIDLITGEIGQLNKGSSQITISKSLESGEGKVFKIGDVLCGDNNFDGRLSAADVLYLVNFIFKGGQDLIIPSVADVNGDGVISAADIIYLVNYLFKTGSAPTCSLGNSVSTQTTYSQSELQDYENKLKEVGIDIDLTTKSQTQIEQTQEESQNILEKFWNFVKEIF